MKRYVFALDLKDDPELFSAYDRHHRAIWPEIRKSIRDAGIDRMEIYRTGNRLFLLMEAGDTFTLQGKEALDASNPRVQDWERLMWTYQQAIPWARPGQKWVLMEKVFEL